MLLDERSFVFIFQFLVQSKYFSIPELDKVKKCYFSFPIDRLERNSIYWVGLRTIYVAEIQNTVEAPLYTYKSVPFEEYDGQSLWKSVKFASTNVWQIWRFFPPRNYKNSARQPGVKKCRLTERSMKRALVKGVSTVCVFSVWQKRLPLSQRRTTFFRQSRKIVRFWCCYFCYRSATTTKLTPRISLLPSSELLRFPIVL